MHEKKKLVLFGKIEECTVNIKCKLAAWLNVLEGKKCKLEDKLRWYRGPFGRVYNYGKTT